ncbi:lipopolysaccharide biosynthesis protein [Halpernia sp. GG3]
MKYDKKAMLNGFLWSAVDKIGVIVVQIVLEIIIARILLPKDYGVFGILLVGISLAQAIADGGFINALIHKQSRAKIVFNTVFYTNLVLSIFMYLLLFFGAPYIADFYDIPILTVTIRVIGISVILNAFMVVQKAVLQLDLNFKTVAKISVISLIISGIVAIYLAENGYGVWALVLQFLIQNVISVILYFIAVKWKPSFGFDKYIFKEFFNFGSKLTLAAIVQSLYINLYTLVIGKQLPIKDLGLFSKGNQFTLMPSSVITGTIQRVLFPYMARHKDDDEKIHKTNILYSEITMLLFFPLFIFIAIFSKDIVILLLSEKWIELVPILRILALSYISFPLINNNMMIFQAKGNGNLFLLVEVLTKITGVIILFVSIIYKDLKILTLGLLLQSILQFIISSLFVNIFLKKTFITQTKILFKHTIFVIFLYAVMSVLPNFSSTVLINTFFKIIIFAIIYSSFYFFFFRDKLLLMKSLFFKNKTN